MDSYDVLVIGSGPGGEKAALQAAKLHKRVAIIEKSHYIGGAGIQTGTLPSKTLREAALYLSGFRQRALYGLECTLNKGITLRELMHRKESVVQSQMEITKGHFARNDIDLIFGEASFKDEHTLSVHQDGSAREYHGDIIIIAVGSRPFRPRNIRFDAGYIYDSDGIIDIDRIPGTLTILGGGVIGCEYACIFACLGVAVTLVDRNKRLLGFADEEIAQSLSYWMRQSGITLKLGEEMERIDVEEPDRIVTCLKSGKRVVSERLLYAIGRLGNTDRLNLAAIGIATDDRGFLTTNSNFQTERPHIYAVGDVIGFPSLAATSMDQGRRAMCHALGAADIEGACTWASYLPFGIYTIPEISMVGETEENLTALGVPFEVGVASFSEVARGRITGDVYGMLKLIFHRETRKLLGVHIIGERASEIIHIGQAVMAYDGTIDYFVDNVFNYPTLSDAYKLAALNGINRL